MEIKLSLKEKFWLVAMCGDVPEFHRRRLFSMAIIRHLTFIGPHAIFLSQAKEALWPPSNDQNQSIR